MTAPTPTRIKALRGTLRPDRLKREAQPKATRPQCPRWLSGDARRAWRRLAPVLRHAGLLTQADQNALARYCRLWQRWCQAEAHIETHGHIVKSQSGVAVTNPSVAVAVKLSAELRQLETAFGLTPSARTRIDVPPPREPLNELEQLIGRGRANRATAGRIEPER